jgi:hypothetical protein
MPRLARSAGWPGPREVASPHPPSSSFSKLTEDSMPLCLR